jgi:hypothetical protein
MSVHEGTLPGGSRKRRVRASGNPRLEFARPLHPRINQEVFSRVILQTDPLSRFDTGTKREHSPRASAPNPQSDADQLEAAADQAIAACGGDAREAVKALIVANQFLETDLEKLKAAVSMGYARGKLFEQIKTLPPDRKDWYD